MKEHEALIYLNANSIEELQTKIEEEVFKIKNSIFSTVFHPKIAFSKIQKLKRIIAIREKLLHSINSADSHEILGNNFQIQSQDVLQCIHQFNAQKSQVFMNLHQTSDLNAIVFYIEQAMQLFLEFAGKWPSFSDIKIKLTKEMDAMLLLKELKTLNENGVTTFNDLRDNASILSDELKHESSRLIAIYKDFIRSQPEFILA